MLILISPAKTLDMESPILTPKPTMPSMTEHSELLIRTLKGFSSRQLGNLMKISEPLAELNRHRYEAWRSTFDSDNARPAIQAFRGDVYVGLDADSLNEDDFNFAQQHLRILSGLYGVLRPLDWIQAYRLEMGTSLKTERGRTLYDFWGDRITEHLNAELHKLSPSSSCVINLASNEYFKAVKKRKLEAPLITPVFKDEKNGNYKVISFFAKKARGAMARHLIEERFSSLDHLYAFKSLGYRLDERLSSEDSPVFLRSRQAAEPYLA